MSVLPSSARRAFTGSSREASQAGMKAASEQMKKALTQMMAISPGTISAGMPSNS